MTIHAYLATQNGNGTTSITRSTPSAVATAASVTTENRVSISFAVQPGDGQLLVFGTSSLSVTFEFDSASTASGGGTPVTLGGSTSATRLAFQTALAASSVSALLSSISSTSETVVRVGTGSANTLQISHTAISASLTAIPVIFYSSSNTDGTVNIMTSKGMYLAINDAVVTSKYHLTDVLRSLERLLSRDTGRVSTVGSLSISGTVTE